MLLGWQRRTLLNGSDNMNAFEFMILENMGMTTTILGRKNKVFKHLDELERRGYNIDADIINKTLKEYDITSDDLTFQDQLRLNGYLTI